jgi:hypothetical protein
MNSPKTLAAMTTPPLELSSKCQKGNGLVAICECSLTPSANAPHDVANCCITLGGGGGATVRNAGRSGKNDSTNPAAEVSTTGTYHIKTVPAQVTDAMEKVQDALPELIRQRCGNSSLEAHGILCRELVRFRWDEMVALG